jgi:hypothetical protein
MNVRENNGLRTVTVDEGNGPVKAVKDGAGRILTREQVGMIRDKQQADLDRVTDLHGKLVAGDAAATADVVTQFKDNLTLRLAMLDRQKAQLQDTLAKLNAGDATATASVVDQMVQRLSRRAEGMSTARDRSAAVLAELDAAGN